MTNALIEEGRGLRALARLGAGSPGLAQVEAWAGEEYERMDPDRILDRDRYVHSFIVCHEILEDARAEWIYLQQHPQQAAPLASLAEFEISNYDVENPVGACKLAISRPDISKEVRIPLRREYIGMFGEDGFENLVAIFEDYINRGEVIPESERRALVHELIFQEMPSVFGLSFADGSEFDWRFFTLIDMTDEKQHDPLQRLIEATLVNFEEEGTIESGDVLLIRTRLDAWGAPGISFLASKRPGRVHVSLDRFELTPEEVALFVAVGWENLRDGEPDALLVKEAWTRQAHELSVEAIWALDIVRGSQPSASVVHLFGSEVVAAASDNIGVWPPLHAPRSFRFDRP